MPKKVLMICLGNICRSPIAEAVFAHIAKQNGQEGRWVVDSAAIGPWHVGKLPDHRARHVLADKNIPYDNRARQVTKADFSEFDIIFGMDDDNINDLNRLAPSEGSAEVRKLTDFDPDGDTYIRDPYYDDGDEGFYKCYEQCVRCCTEFIKQRNQ